MVNECREFHSSVYSTFNHFPSDDTIHGSVCRILYMNEFNTHVPYWRHTKHADSKCFYAASECMQTQTRANCLPILYGLYKNSNGKLIKLTYKIINWLDGSDFKSLKQFFIQTN